MFGTRLVGSVGTGGQNREIAMELLGVGIDDEGTGAFGDRERQRRLAAGGGATYEEDARHQPFRPFPRSTMSELLYLVAPPERRPLDPALIRRAERLAGSGPRWLDPGGACALALERPLEGSRRAELLELVERAQIDHAVLPVSRRRKRLLVCDMDSTIIDIECIDELARHAGIGAEVAELTRRAMAGEIPFREALETRVRMLEGVPVRVIDEICRERLRLHPGARTLVRTMQAHGAFCALVSSGFTEFTRYVRTLVGFDMDQANTLEIRDGVLTGRLVPPLLGPESKDETLHRLGVTRGIATEDAVAVGDGANDIPMLRRAGLGVAYRGHPEVRRHADACITHTDLRSVLYFQGYARDAFRESG